MSKRRDPSLPLFPSEPVDSAAPIELRSYQDRAIRLLRMHVEMGKRRILCVAPTRSGKMILVAAIAKTSTLPILFLAHRLELIDQCVAQLARVGLTNVGVIRSDDERTDPSASIQVASIATLSRRNKPFIGQRIIIFVDEAHRSASDSYRDLIEEYTQANPDVIVIGFTATACRLDGRPLGDIYQVLEVVVTYQELFKRKDWLRVPDGYGIPLLADLSRVRIVGGDYDEGEVAEIMGRLEGDIVRHWLRLAHLHPVFTARGERVPGQFSEGARRGTFLYACTIAHSLSLCARFEREGVKIVHIDGTTPEDQRRAALRDLAAGRIEIVSNVNVFLEGVDVPEMKCVSHCRPTQSITLWRQSACRCLTPWNDVVPLIIDHGGNWDRLWPPHEDIVWSLAGKPQRRTSGAPMKLCKGCFAYVALGCSVCPHCGKVFTPEEMRLPVETNAQLQALQSEPEAMRANFFSGVAIIAATKKLKPGYAAVKYKEKYGEWPPDSWTAKVKADFESDPSWQAAVAAREERKRREEEGLQTEKQEVDRPYELPEDNLPPQEDSFGGWVATQGIAPPLGAPRTPAPPIEDDDIPF